jgi:hypothetical protein
MRNLTIAILLISSALASTGCASLQADIQGRDYPADTAILIGGTAYQINTYKCAKIKSIGDDGALDCYDPDDRKSASITPVSDWRRKLAEQHVGDTWASPKHQAFLYFMFHQGGGERALANAMNGVMQVRDTYSATKGILDSVDKSKEMDSKAAQLKLEGGGAYMRGGTPAWQAHNSKVIGWHLENSRYFLDQANKVKPMEPQ